MRTGESLFCSRYIFSFGWLSCHLLSGGWLFGYFAIYWYFVLRIAYGIGVRGCGRFGREHRYIRLPCALSVDREHGEHTERRCRERCYSTVIRLFSSNSMPRVCPLFDSTVHQRPIARAPLGFLLFAPILPLRIHISHPTPPYPRR